MRIKQRPPKSLGHESVASVIKASEITFHNGKKHTVKQMEFFENNDLTPETWKEFDLSTLSTFILGRNSHQDLQEQFPAIRNGTNESSASTYLDVLGHQQQPLDLEQHALGFQHELNCSPEPVYGPPLVRKPVVSVRSTSASRAPVAHKSSTIKRAQQAPRSKPGTVREKPTIVQKSGNKSRQQQHSKKNQSNSTIESNTFSNHSGQFVCEEPDCGKTFPSLRKLRHHKVVHSNDFPYICEFKGCGKQFKRKFGIDLHSTTHFDLDPHMYLKTSNEESLALFGRRMQYSMCKPCKQRFKTVHEYQDHMLGHGIEPFKCQVDNCGQTFSIWKSFQKHRASHYFNYFCRMDGECDHSTSNLQLLKLHIYCVHFRRTLPENATLSSKNYDVHEDVDDQDVLLTSSVGSNSSIS